jgi:hypothetical protein
MFNKSEFDKSDMVDIVFRFSMLLSASVLATATIFIFLYMGVKVELIEKVIVWLSIPWFVGLYLFCRKFHKTYIKIIESKPPGPGPNYNYDYNKLGKKDVTDK